MNKFRLVLLAVMSVLCASLSAQIKEPVKWQHSLKMTGDNEAVVTFSATIDNGWHLYSTNLPDGGPLPTSIEWDLNGAELVGDIVPSVEPKVDVDMIFHIKLGWWEKAVSLSQKLKITSPGYIIAGNISYMACDGRSCLSPQKEPFSFEGKGAVKSQDDTVAEEAGGAIAALKPAKPAADTWAPVSFDAEVLDKEGVSIADKSLWYILLLGFIGGLIAILTPCIWSMIPLTVSFFLKRSDNRKRSIADAIIYGISIIVIYLLLGLIITLVFGAGALNAMSTNAVFNLAFFALLVVFAISFFGAFEIELPSSWANKMDSRASRTTGIISIFLMAFTLTLVSFSCTGPIIGTLLVEAANVGNIVGPAVGMFGFAAGLAIPFVLFAIFPSGLKSMPKSGGWLNSVKVVLGFIELALSLKFLSVADLAYGWGILDREVFVALWIVIFALLGIYLLGKLRFPHDSKTESIGVTRFFLALFSLAFAVYLLPGLWGAPLKSVSAFVPPLYTQDFNLYDDGVQAQFTDYDEGMEYALKNDKNVLLVFSGYGCVNCRKMEGAVFDNERVRTEIAENFVMIHLMVDDRTPLPSKEKVTDNGKQFTLSNYGKKWSYLQRHKFAANSQPYNVVIDASGKLISGPCYFEESVDNFMDFLQKGKKQ